MISTVCKRYFSIRKPSASIISARRIRQMAHPITTMKWPLPSINRHHNVQRDNPFWQQKISEGKFMLPDPLRDRQDWTFLDGRPTPLNEAQLALKMEQIELAKDIVNSLREIKDAETEYQLFMKQQEQSFQAAQQAKPKAKGVSHPRLRAVS